MAWEGINFLYPGFKTGAQYTLTWRSTGSKERARRSTGGAQNLTHRDTFRSEGIPWKCDERFRFVELGRRPDLPIRTDCANGVLMQVCQQSACRHILALVLVVTRRTYTSLRHFRMASSTLSNL